MSAQKWCAESFETNSSHPENLIHTTLAGHKVRSKSEVIISNLLYTNQIPYRYEAALPLKEFTAYPDLRFYIRLRINLLLGAFRYDG